ncbi:type II toxin-antitoxin system Phd/YefM family antitoxin [Paraburkholderia bannensis]|uniref:type II toxin-antitoxin system Phd/YefM family antitoxin n=1 Tax=Paraburkholderia bannensis TaxID=765414 RepID=UPI002AB7B669|nr:prevent-host-death protein [Paraburkholderia bannensis]
MDYTDVSEASLNLASLIEDIEIGRRQEVIIARDGQPVACLVPFARTTEIERRIGVAKAHLAVPDEIDVLNDEIVASFDRKE